MNNNRLQYNWNVIFTIKQWKIVMCDNGWQCPVSLCRVAFLSVLTEFHRTSLSPVTFGFLQLHNIDNDSLYYLTITCQHFVSPYQEELRLSFPPCNFGITKKFKGFLFCLSCVLQVACLISCIFVLIVIYAIGPLLYWLPMVSNTFYYLILKFNIKENHSILSISLKNNLSDPKSEKLCGISNGCMEER